LLLQPLIENALRHDLDRHDGPTRLALRFQFDGARLRCQVWNSLGDRGPANPGLGLGLAHTRERLALVYGRHAALEIRESASSFEALVELPSRHAE
jgi:LytS/YehU family sensor histidine kinase